MALRLISRLGHPILRNPARDLTRDELMCDNGQRLIDDMIETMRDAEGAAIAAPQIFEPFRLITAEVVPANPEDEKAVNIPLHIIVNPVLAKVSKEIVHGWEGCLSIPDMRGVVPRHEKVVVQGFDRRARAIRVEAEGFFARILQHEIDHLDGLVFLDRMEDMKTLTFTKEFERFWMRQEGEEEEEEAA